MRPASSAQIGRDARGQERTEPAHQPLTPWAHRPTAATDLLPPGFPPHVTDGRYCLVSRPRVSSGIREVLGIRVFVAGGTRVRGRPSGPPLLSPAPPVPATTTHPH